jgi:hypothetical protein
MRPEPDAAVSAGGPFRWLVLVVYCASAFSGNLSSFALASIAKKAAAFYGVGWNMINLYSILGMLAPFLGYLPGWWLADTSTRLEVPYCESLARRAGGRRGRAAH